MRVILYTGKGGVGKTSMAAATALRCARKGHKSLVISTDAAHSLGDAFEIRLNSNPVEIEDNLFALEVDVDDELKRNWGAIQGFLTGFFQSQGLDDIVAEELAVLPELEDVFSLLKLREYFNEGIYDVVIIDCAPTGSTMRLLIFPDIARWYMEKLFPVERRIVKMTRPIVQKLIDIPIPDDEVFHAVESIYTHIAGTRDMLMDGGVSSVRIVFNPERMILKESQRAFSYLCLFGYHVDAVIANRVIPKDMDHPYFSKWLSDQEEYIKEATAVFHPIPVLKASLADREMIGKEKLLDLAGEVFGKFDPSERFSNFRPINISSKDGSSILKLNLGDVNKKDLDIGIRGEELVIKAGVFKRVMSLPRAMAKMELERARVTKGGLEIIFKKRE